MGALYNPPLSSVTYGMVWINVDKSSLTTNSTYNIGYLQGLIASIQEAESTVKHGVGIRTNILDYNAIIGTFTGFSNLPLWYVQYDSTPSFAGFVPFGGWTKPTMKSFAVMAQSGSDEADVVIY